MQSIRSKMILLIAVPTLIIYVVALGLTMSHLRKSVRAEVEGEVTQLAANYAARFDGAFREAATIATTTARFVESVPNINEDQLYAQLSSNVAQNEAVYGAAIAFEPGMFRTGEELFCPYVYRGVDGLESMNITREALDWYGEEKWAWWHLPKQDGVGVWTDPYFDEGAGNVLMTTYSEPFARDGAFWGVTTVDIMLTTLNETLGNGIVDDVRYVIMTRDGHFVYHWDESRIMTGSAFEFAQEAGREDLADVCRRIVSGESGLAEIDGWDSPGREWIFYAPIPSTGWAFAARVSEGKALAAANGRMAFAAVAMALTLVAIIACIVFVAGKLARPIRRLRGMALEIADGNLDAHVEGINDRDEIGDLATAFNKMTADLRTHVDHLANERAAREKIERDLDLAREIQRGLLPETEPGAAGFDIAGWNQAADQTGGDFFDWLTLPDGRVILVLADVTGHGIGPALIVAVCRAYMRAAAGTEAALEDAVARVNDLLHSDIPSNRFVTAAIGILDPSTSEMSLLSAGQAPLLFYEAATGAVHNWDADDIPLGIAGGMSFTGSRTISFKPGDILCLTTDGFFEWANHEGELYGTERLVNFLQNEHARSSAEFIEALHAAVLEHAGGTAQADDLTALIVRKS